MRNPVTRAWSQVLHHCRTLRKDAGAAARYRSVIDNDLAMGHVNAGVHAQISNEIAEAASACAAGQDGRAQSLLRASKSRHGYPG